MTEEEFDKALANIEFKDPESQELIVLKAILEELKNLNSKIPNKIDTSSLFFK